jgi:hypothetical protein
MLPNKALIGIVAIAALGVTALAAYVRMVPHATVPKEQPAASAPIVVPPPVVTPKRESVMVTVYNPSMSASGISFEAQQSAVPEGADPKAFAVSEFLKAAQITPANARLLAVQVIDGVAHLGFNRDFDRTYGTFEEKSLLDGFAAALGQFSDVNSYVLEIDGKPVATLGSVSLGEPVLVIRPADVPRTPANTPPPTPSDLPPTDKPSTPDSGSTNSAAPAPSGPSDRPATGSGSPQSSSPPPTGTSK